MIKIKSTYKISTTILFIFSFLVGIVVVSILLLQYNSSKDLAYKAVQQNIQFISDKTMHEINSLNLTSNNVLTILELSEKINTFPNKYDNHIMLQKFTTAISNQNYIYAMYIGYENGNFYEVINLSIDPLLKKKYKSNNGELWLSLKIFNTETGRVRVEEYLDKDLNIKRTIKKRAIYNPTIRPWYNKSITSTQMTKTAPYLFSNLGSMGITYSKKVQNSQNVLGIDISLNTFSNFLQKQEIYKGTKLYIFDSETNKIIASNDSKEKETELFQNQINSLIKNKNTDITIDGIDYFLSLNQLQLKDTQDEYLITLIPKKEIMKPYNEKILFAFYLNIILMIVILPLIWFSSKIIINPIKNLEIENIKIKNRQYDKIKLVETPIKEINELSNSIYQMAGSIREYEEAQIKLMDSFIELIASAIDKKSEYTGGHGQRVPEITMMIANQASESKDGIFKDFTLKNEEEIRELKIAALLHDCGKITTPEYVVDKATKLETIYNRIHEIRTRFEIVHRDLEIAYYKKIQNGKDQKSTESWMKTEQQKLQENFTLIANANIGSEFMKEEDVIKIIEISKYSWERNFDNTLGLSKDERKRLTQEDNSKIENLLCDKQSHIIKRTSYFQYEYEKDGFKGTVPNDLYNLGEIYNLTIRKGTLTKEERFKINEHIIMTIKMLEQLPFPKHLQKVPEYAGGHHETLIGTGYPKQLTKDQMSIPARIMAIADIFEALTASDRPYKETKKLSEALKILSFMVKDQHIDKDLFELFLTTGIYKTYANQYLHPEQIDNIDINDYIS